MATRSRTSSQKRQREIARMEKQREKAAKRMERRLAAKQPRLPEETSGEPEAPAAEADSAE